MPTIEHFEIPADDLERAKKFYSEMFGWTYETWPGFDYMMIHTTNDRGDKGLCGGMMKRVHPQQGITNYVAVSSLADYTAKVEKLGGKVLIARQDVPNAGAFAVIHDSEGNAIALWESAKKGC